MKLKSSHARNLFNKYAIVLKIGLLTSATILFFKVVSLFVLYHFIRFDLYLCLVAILFFILGAFLHKTKEVLHDPLSSDELLPVKTNPLSQLSGKELQVMMLLAEGKTNKEIAAIQFIEISTVKTHVNHIYAKLAVSNRKEARNLYYELRNQSSF